MLEPRLIPCLLIRNGGLVKTVQFDSPRYIGDPLNTVRIFNEKGVDELMVVDIDATVLNKGPNEKLISDLASECRAPLCYCGGIKSLEQIGRLISVGVEKVGISSAAIDHPDLITNASKQFGSQSVVVVIDVRINKQLGRYEVFTHNGSRATGLDPGAFARAMERRGAGEIVINSIDNDGRMQGYDLMLSELIRKEVSLPLTVLGGAGSILDIQKLILQQPIIGAAAGSLFVYKGKYRAVLINYPSCDERRSLLTIGRQQDD
jgi:cyclase